MPANPLFMRVAGLLDGAGEMNRTPDLLITNEQLCIDLLINKP